MLLGQLALAQTTSPYRRPGSARQLAALPEISGPEQVHLSLGGPSEMVITYATADEAPSSVEWWDASGATLTADGTAAAYSQLIYIEDELLDPAIGLGDTNASTLLDMQDTSAWALRDPFYGLRHGHGSSYHSSSEVRTKLLSYKNPQAIYNSPLVHTVRLSNLLPSATYGYRVGGGSDARNFSFTMPPDGDGAAFPLTFGLTADIGQTVVSKLNAEWLLSQLSDAEPYAARNSSDRAARNFRNSPTAPPPRLSQVRGRRPPRRRPFVRRRLLLAVGLVWQDDGAAFVANRCDDDGRQPRDWEF